MAEVETRSVMATDWHRLYAFGWPAGSVRAAHGPDGHWTASGRFSLSITDQEVPAYLRDLLFIILGHYFAVRGRQASDVEQGPPPLYLPRGSVRIILVAGFLVTAVLLYRRGALLAVGQNPAVVRRVDPGRGGYRESLPARADLGALDASFGLAP